MKKFRNLTALVLALVLSLSLCIPAFAAETASTAPLEEWAAIDIDEEIERALNGITDTDIPDELQGIASAAVLDDNGNEVDVPVEVYVTTRKLTPSENVSDIFVVSGGQAERTEYVTTAVAVMSTAKSDTSTDTKENVTATLTIHWTDVFGLSNNFDGLAGSWKVASGKTATLTNRYYAVQGKGPGNNGPVYRDYIPDDENINEFYLTSGAYEDGWTTYVARSEVRVNNSVWLVVNVSTGQIN